MTTDPGIPEKVVRLAFIYDDRISKYPVSKEPNGKLLFKIVPTTTVRLLQINPSSLYEEEDSILAEATVYLKPGEHYNRVAGRKWAIKALCKVLNNNNTPEDKLERLEIWRLFATHSKQNAASMPGFLDSVYGEVAKLMEQ